LQPHRSEFEAKGFTCFVISFGSEEDLNFLREAGVARVLLDPDSQAFEGYNVTGIPRTIVVDRRGTVYKDLLGWGGQPSVNEFIAIVDDLTGR